MNIWEEIQVNFQNMIQDFAGLYRIIHALMILIAIGWLHESFNGSFSDRHTAWVLTGSLEIGVHRFSKTQVKNGFSGILSRICFGPPCSWSWSAF